MMQTIKALYLQSIELLMHLVQLLLLLLQASLKSGQPINATLLACTSCTSSVRPCKFALRDMTGHCRITSSAYGD